MNGPAGQFWLLESAQNVMYQFLTAPSATRCETLLAVVYLPNFSLYCTVITFCNCAIQSSVNLFSLFFP